MVFSVPCSTTALPPPSPLQFLFSLLRYLRLLLLIHGFGIEQEETEITENYICHCLNLASAYVGFLRSLFNPRLRADSRIHKSVAADGSRRTFPQLLRSAPTPVGGYDFLNPPWKPGLRPASVPEATPMLICLSPRWGKVDDIWKHAQIEIR